MNTLSIRFKLVFLLSFFVLANSYLNAQCSGSSVALGADQFYCVGTPVTLTPAVTNSPTGTATYAWTFQGNPISPNPTGSTYTIPVNQSGTYSVTVEYGPNCSLTDDVVVGFLSVGSIGNNQTICINGNPAIINSISNASISSPAAIEYQWQSSTDNVTWTNISGTNSASYDPPTLGQDTYYRRVANIQLNNVIICAGNSNSIFVDVLPNFTIDAGNNINTCVGQNISIVPTVTGITGYSPTYSWSGPNNFATTNSSLSINSIQQNASGQYTVTSTIGNCTVQDQVTIDAIGISITSGFFNPNNTQLVACLSAQETSGDIGFIINLPTTLSSIQSININWGDGNTGLIPSSNYSNLQFHNYLPGSYQLAVTMISTSGCSHVISYPVFVGSSPSPAALQLFINQANGCVPYNTNYTFSVPITNVNGTTYTINWGDGSPLEIYTHPNTPANLTHTFINSSCGNNVSTINGSITTTYNNVFQPSVITQNPCSLQPQPSAAGLISVGLPPDASFIVSKNTICPGGSIQLTNTSNFGLTIPTAGGASCINTAPYYWVITPISSPGNNWTVTSGSLGSNNGFITNQSLWTTGSTSLIIQFSNPGIYTIELRVKNPCGLDVTTQTICVIDPPTSVISPYSTIQCSPAALSLSSNSILPTCGTTPIPVAYLWSVTNPTGCSSCSSTISSPTSANSNFTFTNNSNSIQTYTVNLSVTPLDPITNLPLSSPGCSNTSSIPIQVYPSVQITPITTCNGTLNWNLANQVNVPSTFTWQAADNAYVSGETTTSQSTSSITDVLVNNSTTAQTVTYTVNAVSVTGSCTATNTFTVNLVTPLSVQALTNQTICVGGGLSAPLVLNYSGGSGSATYSWSLNSSTSQIATTASYSPPTFNTVGSYLYTGTVFSGPSGCVQNVSQSATITVVADPTITTQPINASYCQNASPVTPLSVIATGGTGSFNYQWYSNLNNTNSGGQSISGANLSTFTPPNSSIGNYYYYCIITQTGLNCSVVSNVVQVVVNAPPTITSQPQNQTICVGGTLTTLNVGFSGGTTNPTYQWYSNTTNANTGGTLLSGETNANLTLPTTLNGTASNSFYYCVINFGSASGCSVITSNAATISVLADPTFSVQPIQSQTICQGGSLTNPLTVVVIGGSGNSTYQWYTVNGTTYNSIANSNSANYNPSVYSTVGNFTYAVSVTQTVSGCASTYSTNAEVIVAADPTVSISSGANYCQNASAISPLTVSATNGNGSAFTYQWFSNSTNTNSGGIPQGNSNSTSFSPPVNATGTLYYYCIVTNAPSSTGCSTTSNTAAITVNAGPSISTPPQSQAVCVGGTLSALNVAYTGGTGSVTYQWYSNATNTTSGGTPVGTSSSSYALPSTLNASVGTFYYYCELSFGGSGGCSQITSSVATINVVASPIVTAPTSQTICTGGNPLAMSVSASGGINSSYSYQWFNASGAISTANSVNYSPPSSAGTYYCIVSILPSTSGCSTNSANATVTIEPDPTISAPQSANYCQNAGTVAALSVTANGGISSAYVYQWYSSTNNNTTSGTAISAANGGTSASYTPPVNNTGTFYYYCVASINPSSSTGCSVTSDIATLTVNQSPSFATQPIANQTICLDGNFSPLTVVHQNGTGTPTYQWYSNTVNNTTNSTLVPNETNASYTPPSNVVGTTYYYCVATFASGGCSSITSALAAANVVADPTIDIQPFPAQSICVGGTISTALTATVINGTGTTSYQWSTTSGTITGATSQTFLPPSFNTVGSYSYSVTVTLSGSGCNSVGSQNAVIDVIADPVVSVQPIDAAYCQNASPIAPLSVSATGGLGTFSYQWYSNSSNTNNGGILIPGATLNSYTPSVSNTGVQYYYCLISQTGLNCSVSSATAAITVNPAPTFSTQPIASQTICLNGTLNPLSVVYQNGTGVPTYQWFSNFVNSTSGGTAISVETTSTYSPPSNTVGTTYYYCVATFSSGGCSAVTSTIGTVVILADPTISTQPIPSQSICVGGTIATALSASSTGGTGTISYQWSNSSGAITGATSQTFLPPSFSNTGQFNFTVTITLSGSGCDAMTSNVALIDVISDPTVSTQPVGTSYCENGSPVSPLTVAATGGIGTFSYQWYSNTVNTNTGGSLIPLASSTSFTPPVSTVGTTYYYCVITQSGLNCGVTSNTSAIIVNPAPTFSTQPIPSQTVCLDGTFNALTVVYQNGTGVPTYQWFSNATSSTSNGTILPNETNATYTPPSSTVGTTYYYCVATFASGGCSAITSNLATATVVEDPTIGIQPIPTQSICVGGTIANALAATSVNGTGAASYQWSNSTGSISGATSQTYLPPAFSTIGAYTYFVTITLSGNGCNATISQNAVIDVVADPVVSVQPISASYCQNGTPVAPLAVGATGGIGNFSYQWYSSNSNSVNGGTIISGANSSTYIPSVTNIGTIYYYCVISQSGLNCSVTSNTAGIIVNQAPVFLTQPVSQTICTGGVFDLLSVSYQFGTGVPTYQWYSNTTNSYSGAVAIAGANSSTYQAPSSSTGSNFYFCDISFSFGGCSNISSSISNQVVVVDPTITTQPLPNQTICVGGTITSPLNVIVSGGTGITTYQWFQGTNQIINATQSTFLPVSFVNAGMYTYQVNINSTGVGCAALISQQVNVEVLDDPLVTSPTSAIYCQNSPVVAPLQVIVSGGAGTNNYQWYYSASNVNTGGLQIAGASTSSYLPSVSVVGTSYYYCIVTQSTPNCSNVSNNAAIQINQPPTISAQPIQSQTICEGGTPSQLQVSYINGTNSATYQWYVSNTNSNTGGAPILNETNSFYTPPTILIGSNYYYCVITFQSGGCSTLTSATAQVSVVNDPAINIQPLNAQVICQGNTINSPLNFTYSGGTGNSTIAWYLNATPPILINGVTTSSFLPIPFNVADTFFYYATLTFDGVGCNSISTQQAEIIVHPTPYALNLNDTIVVCNHGNLTIPLTASVTSTFVWHTTNNPAVTGESFLNQTSYSIDDSLSNSSTSPQFLTYTVTPTSFPYGCVGPDSTVTVQVQPDVILSMNPSMEICSDSPVNAILTSNIPSTFSWFVSVNNPNVTGESILPSSSPLVNDVLVNTSSVNQVVVYAVFPISIQGQCAGTAQPLLVTVKPPIQLLNPDTLTICSGQNTNINLVANTNVQFNWYASPSLNVIGETTSVVSSALINDVLLNLTNAVETITYNVIGTSSANGCSSPVLPLYVVVNPIPEVFDANPINICNGAYLYPVSLLTTVTGGTTNWTVLNNNIGIPSNFGSNTIPGFTAINNSIITQTGQISVTPIYTNNSVTCIGNDTTLLIHVLPTPTVNSIQDIVACNLEQVPLTPVNGPVPNTVYQWVNANTTVGLNVSGIGDIPIFVGQNSGILPISGSVSVSPTYIENNVSCQGAPIDFTITINPSPTLLNSDIEICDGTNTNILLNANISSTFLWNATINQNVYNETSTPIQTGAFINDLLVLAGTTIQTVEYNITPISTPYGCYGNETTINVLINPLPIVDFSIINPILCNQSSINFQNNSVGPLAYTWAFGDGDSSFLFNPVHEYANFGSYPVTLSAIDQLTGCVNQYSQTLIIHETPEPNFIQSDSIACGSLEVLFTALDLNPTWQYQWDFGDGASSNQYGLAGHQFVTNGCFDVSLVVITPEGCTSDSTQLSAVCIYPEPMASFSIDDAVISSLAPEVTFFNTSVHADTYLWDFGDNTTSITQDPTHLYPSDPATYVIVLTASNFIGCQDTAALTVTVFQDLAIYVPNTFTPDGDEYNQSFLPILTEGFKKETYQLTIFDRWGAVVFESKDYRFGWEGTYKFSEHGPVKNGLFFKDITCPDGTYIWKISIEVLQTGETKEFLGHVNLLR